MQTSPGYTFSFYGNKDCAKGIIIIVIISNTFVRVVSNFGLLLCSGQRYVYLSSHSKTNELDVELTVKQKYISTLNDDKHTRI